jgi:hypothetical protein
VRLVIQVCACRIHLWGRFILSGSGLDFDYFVMAKYRKEENDEIG